MLLQSLVACTWISSWLQLDGLCSASWFVWAWRECSYCWCWSSLLIDREISNTQRMDGTPLLPIGALRSHILSGALQAQSLALQGSPELLTLAFQVLETTASSGISSSSSSSSSSWLSSTALLSGISPNTTLILKQKVPPAASTLVVSVSSNQFDVVFCRVIHASMI